MKYHDLSDLEKCYLLRDITIGRYKKHKSRIKILYSIFLLHKNAKNKKFKSLFPSKNLIADVANVSVRSVGEFINADVFSAFCLKRKNGFTSNEYFLAQWVIDVFLLLQKRGVFKHIQNDFEKFFKCYQLFFDKCIIKMVLDGSKLEDVLNNLSTKRKRILPGVKPRILPTIKPFRYGIKPSVSKSNSEGLDVPAVKDFYHISQTLVGRFQIKEGDVNLILRRYNLNHHSQACKLMDLYRLRGMKFNSPIRVYQSCLKKTTKRNFV